MGKKKEIEDVNNPFDSAVYSFSVREIDEFQNLRFWSAITDILKDRLNDKRNELEKADDMNTVCEIQGHILEIRNLLSIPDAIKESINFIEESEKEESSDNEGEE